MQAAMSVNPERCSRPCETRAGHHPHRSRPFERTVSGVRRLAGRNVPVRRALLASIIWIAATLHIVRHAPGTKLAANAARAAITIMQKLD